MHIFSLEYTTWFSKVLSCCASSFPCPPFWKGSTVKFQPKSMWILRQILKTLTWSTSYLWKCFLLCLSILQNALVWVTAPLQWCFWLLASCVSWHLSFLCWDHLQSDEEMLDNTIPDLRPWMKRVFNRYCIEWFGIASKPEINWEALLQESWDLLHSMAARMYVRNF